MCLRVFVATVHGIEPTPPFEGRPPPLSLHVLAPAFEAPPALAGAAQVIEAGSHTGCACGFAAPLVAFASCASRRSELAELEGALTAAERDELDLSQASRDALCAVLADALSGGPVRIYSCWWGEEAEPAARAADATLAEIADALDPFPDRVVLNLTG